MKFALVCSLMISALVTQAHAGQVPQRLGDLRAQQTNYVGDVIAKGTPFITQKTLVPGATFNAGTTLENTAFDSAIYYGPNFLNLIQAKQPTCTLMSEEFDQQSIIPAGTEFYVFDISSLHYEHFNSSGNFVIRLKVKDQSTGLSNIKIECAGVGPTTPMSAIESDIGNWVIRKKGPFDFM